MNGMILAFGVSVLASLVTVILIFTTRICWWWFFENVWLMLTCRHVPDISGEWTTTNKNDLSESEETIVIRQYGWKIRGMIDYVHCGPNNERTLSKFEMEGILRNDILSAFYWNKDNRRKGSGSFSLALIKNGDTLKGAFAFYNTEDSSVVHGEYEWGRKS